MSNEKIDNCDRLYAYAKKLHCEKTIRTYLEVLI